MSRSNVEDYAEFTRRAAEAPGLANDARLTIEWRTDESCRVARARMRVGERARRGRYGELLAVEVARATSSPAAFAAAARETDARLTAAEAQWAAERQWKGLKREIDRRRPTRQPATSGRTTVTPHAPAAPRPARSPARAAAANPLTAHAEQLEREGLHWAARDERRQIADAEHKARRRRVEAEVARTQKLFEALTRNYGTDYATRYMEGA
jgi:hypothetical protein